MANKDLDIAVRSQERDVTPSEQGSVGTVCAFRGCYEHSMDSKGRVSVPSSFRQVLSEKSVASLVLTNFISDGARCLEGFSLLDWQVFEQKLRGQSRFREAP